MDPASHKSEHHVRDIPTRSVTLFPARAQVVRELRNISLNPGFNEVTIVGLTPTLDEDSIQVEGTGSAVISDIAVELVPNQDIYEDVYPDSDEDSSDGDSDNKDPFYRSESEEDEDEELDAIQGRITDLRDQHKIAAEAVASAQSRLSMLDKYGQELEHKSVDTIGAAMQTYKEERQGIFDDYMTGMKRERDLIRQIKKAQKEESRLLHQKLKESRKGVKTKLKEQKEKKKRKAQETRRKANQLKEKARIRKERERFWPKFCYSVRVTLDTHASITPMASRRGSVISATDSPTDEKKSISSPEIADAKAPSSCDLVVSYVTTSAFWAPGYDLQLSTTKNTATLCFDAQLTNATSETWSNCKINLSTSQASFAGLDDNIPVLQPWRIKLLTEGKSALHGPLTDVLESQEERDEIIKWKNRRHKGPLQKPRWSLFGPSDGASYRQNGPLVDNNPWATSGRAGGAEQHPTQTSALFGGSIAPPLQAQQTTRGGFGSAREDQASAPAPSGGGLFGSQPVDPPRTGGLFGSAQAAQSSGEAQTTSGFGSNIGPRGGLFGQVSRSAEPQPPPPPPAPAPAPAPQRRDSGSSDAVGPFAEDDHTMLEPQPELEFQESAVEETGFTTTYDLPGLKTLAPRSTPSKQRVARVSLSNVVFSHTVVAKYKPVAFLKAKLRNSSNFAFLKGRAGLTLDGTFMGRTTLPRCSIGDTFTLSLGADPAVKVLYPRAEVRRATSGMFKQEDSSIFSRCVTLANTRSSSGGGKQVHVLVIDQVPVSEDDRLKVHLVQPSGMIVDGKGVAAGMPGRDTKDDKAWGNATAMLKKNGELRLDVTLEAGMAVKLPLEYAVAMPSGSQAVQCTVQSSGNNATLFG